MDTSDTPAARAVRAKAVDSMLGLWIDQKRSEARKESALVEMSTVEREWRRLHEVSMDVEVEEQELSLLLHWAAFGELKV
jgi:hypothetical protein